MERKSIIMETDKNKRKQIKDIETEIIKLDEEYHNFEQKIEELNG